MPEIYFDVSRDHVEIVLSYLPIFIVAALSHTPAEEAVGISLVSSLAGIMAGAADHEALTEESQKFRLLLKSFPFLAALFVFLMNNDILQNPQTWGELPLLLLPFMPFVLWKAHTAESAQDQDDSNLDDFDDDDEFPFL